MSFSHLSLYDHFDSEGDEVGEELFQPVWSERQQQTHVNAVCVFMIPSTVQFSNLLFVAVQVQTELVKVQITV